MERREAPRIVPFMLNACALLLALLPLCITRANSELDKPVARDDEHPGFISIDCGSSVEYQDPGSGIWYKPDKGFVETGMNKVISSTIDVNYANFGKQLNTLRYFPEGDRNCYTLRPEQGKNNRYLMRAFFTYGNYDGKNQTPSFELHLGVNLWDQINITVDNAYAFREVIHTPSSDTIHVCLVKTGPTAPFISSLELRLLDDRIYDQGPMYSSSDPQPLLKLEVRVDVGSPQSPAPDNNDFFRYKDDVYDRIWRYDDNYNNSGWYPFNEPVDIDPGSNGDIYKLPAQVLRTAARSQGVSYNLSFDFDSVFVELDKPYEYYVYFHFAEIEQLPDGQKRIMDITLNSKPVLSPPLVLEYLKPVSLRFVAPGSVWFDIIATSQSDAPPLLNAFEIYQLITELDTPTHTQDVADAMWLLRLPKP